MALAGDSILVTPGSGATLATHAVSSKEHETWIPSSSAGHMAGSRELYVARIPNQVHISGGGVHWDLFNADASLIVRVWKVLQTPDITTAVTGVGQDWLIYRSNTVGTGGTTITPWLANLSGTTLDADITCRSKPTGGAAQTTTNWHYYTHSEETSIAAIALFTMQSVAAKSLHNLIPLPLALSTGLVLRQNQGLAVTQSTGTAAGNSAWTIVFSVE